MSKLFRFGVLAFSLLTVFLPVPDGYGWIELLGLGLSFGMILEDEIKPFNPEKFNLSGVTVLGTSPTVDLDQNWPVEEIVIVLHITCGATGPTFVAPDGPLNTVKRVQLLVHPGNGVDEYMRINYSGPGLLEYASLAGLNLDAATWEAIRLGVVGSMAANMKFRLAYRIPMVPPAITENLRTRMLLDVHNHDGAPELTLDFESASNIYSAGSFSSIETEILLLRRRITDSYNAEILAKGGFIKSDLLESTFDIAPGISGEQRIPLNLGARYANLCFRHYKGVATPVVRDVFDEVTTFGKESKWRIESAGVVKKEFRWKDLQIVNDWSRPQVGIKGVNVGTGFIAATSGGVVTTALTNATSGVIPTVPNFAGAIAADTSYRPASSCMLDFLTPQGLTEANELGSTLDGNLKGAQKLELIGPVSAAVTNAHKLYWGGHRIFGDLGAWITQKV